jgi:hypothetical protein
MGLEEAFFGRAGLLFILPFLFRRLEYLRANLAAQPPPQQAGRTVHSVDGRYGFEPR